MASKCAISVSDAAELACTMTAAKRAPAASWAAITSWIAGRVASAVMPTTSGSEVLSTTVSKTSRRSSAVRAAASPKTPRTVSPVVPMDS
ncbi:hypothetical protein D3C73_1142930 [compost metagenome]